MKVHVHGAILITRMWALASHLKVLRQSFFRVMGKVLSIKGPYYDYGFMDNLENMLELPSKFCYQKLCVWFRIETTLFYNKNISYGFTLGLLAFKAPCAKFRKMFLPSYVILRIQRKEGKQCRSRWGSSWTFRSLLSVNSASVFLRI